LWENKNGNTKLNEQFKFGKTIDSIN